MLNKNFSLLIVALFLTISGFTQQYLLINTHKHSKRQYFTLNQTFSFNTVFSDKVQTGRITNFDSTSVEVDFRKINFTDIKTVFVTRQGVAIFSTAFIIFGLGYFALDVINSGGNGITPLIDSQVVRTSVSTLAAGLILKPFQVIKIKLPEDAKIQFVKISSE